MRKSKVRIEKLIIVNRKELGKNRRGRANRNRTLFEKREERTRKERANRKRAFFSRRAKSEKENC